MEKRGEPHSLRRFSTGKGGEAPSPRTAEVPGADGTTRQQRASPWKSEQRPGRCSARVSAGCVPACHLAGMRARTEGTRIVNQSPPEDPAAGSPRLVVSGISSSFHLLHGICTQARVSGHPSPSCGVTDEATTHAGGTGWSPPREPAEFTDLQFQSFLKG